MRRLFTTVAVIATFLLTLAPAPAGAAEVTEFPFTEAVYNTCNNDLLVLNGNLVDSTEVRTDKNGGVTFKHRVAWKDVRVASSTLGLDYTVDSRTTDTFTTKVRNGTETQRSKQTFTLRLTPRGGADGALRVKAVVEYRTNAQGITRTVDSFSSTCG